MGNVGALPAGRTRDTETHLPDTQQFDQKVIGESTVEHLTDQVDITSQSRLEHDRHVGCVEQFNGVASPLTPHLARLDWNFNPESLQVNDDGENRNCRKEVHDIRQPFPVESFFQSSGFIVPSKQEVEKGDDGSFEFGASASVDGVGGEGFPNNVFTNVGSDKEGDTGS